MRDITLHTLEEPPNLFDICADEVNVRKRTVMVLPPTSPAKTCEACGKTNGVGDIVHEIPVGYGYYMVLCDVCYTLGIQEEGNED